MGLIVHSNVRRIVQPLLSKFRDHASPSVIHVAETAEVLGEESLIRDRFAMTSV